MPYVSIKEAAEALGVSQDTIRRRIKAGEIPAQQEPMGSGYRWLVDVPEDAAEDAAQARGPTHTATAEGQAVELSAAALELERLRTEVAGLERLVSEVSADRDHWREHAHRSQVMAETAQRLAERAQPPVLPAGATEPAERSELPTPAHHRPKAALRASATGAYWRKLLCRVSVRVYDACGAP